MPYDRQYAYRLIEWADTEVVGFSPLSLRSEELVLLLKDKLERGRIDFAQDIMKELRECLEELARQRRYAMGLQVNGSEVRRDPIYIRTMNFLTTNPSIPDSHREWAISHIEKGENYG